MTFGWQGFQFEHPDDWAPVLLQGDRNAGCARLDARRGMGCQVRWEQSRKAKPEQFLDAYLKRLPSAKRNGLSYSWQGGHGIAACFGERTFVIESPARPHRLLETFFVNEEEPLWSVFGLAFRLPAWLDLKSFEFLAGKTSLSLSGRGVKVFAVRLALAEQLLRDRTVSEVAAQCFPRLEWNEGIGEAKHARGLAVLQPERDQIVVLVGESKADSWLPGPEWLTE